MHSKQKSDNPIINFYRIEMRSTDKKTIESFNSNIQKLNEK